MTKTDEYQDKILKQYFQLSNPMRSVAGQIAVQIAVQYHLYFLDFTSMAAFIKSFGYDPFDNLTKKYGNFWYKVRAGKIANTKKHLYLFFEFC